MSQNLMLKSLQTELFGLKRELQKSINRKEKYEKLQLELNQLIERYKDLKITLDGKTIEADKLILLSKEDGNFKFEML